MSDDLDWADALAGRPSPNANAATRADALLLREAARRWPLETPPLALPEPDALIAQARREGLLAPRRGWCPGCLERWRRWTTQPAWLGGAGLVLASLLGVWLVAPGVVGWPTAEDAVRAPVAALNLRRSVDPAAARDLLAARLNALQVPVLRYERLGRYGIDADLPRPPAPALTHLLHDEALVPAADGSLRVEFEKAAP